MSALLKNLMNLLKYKPTDNEGFELTEEKDIEKQKTKSDKNVQTNKKNQSEADNDDSKNKIKSPIKSTGQGGFDNAADNNTAGFNNESADSNVSESQIKTKNKNNTGRRIIQGGKKGIDISEWNKRRKNENQGSPMQADIAGNLVSKDIKMNLSKIKQEFNLPLNKDIVIREFRIATKIPAFIVMIDGMIDRMVINDFVLKQLMSKRNFEDFEVNSNNENIADFISDRVLSINQLIRGTDFKTIVMQILDGSTALFIDNCEECILIDAKGFEKRNVERPINEIVVRGSNESFTEDMRTNLTLIRRIIKNKNLVTEIIPVGEANNNSCAVMYLQGITNPKIINEVKRRLQSLKYDFIPGAGMIEEAISDQPFMLIPQLTTTERPDRAAAMLIEGKVVIITQGTPFASGVPVVFWESLHSPEDFFLKWQAATVVRFVRLLALLISSLVPALYVALTTYHQEMIPTDLLIAVAKARENVPFPAILELLVMDVAFELIREASIRMPGALGGTLGIIGALILGQAAVSAQIVSPILIIVVAVAGIGNFAIPSYGLAFSVRILRFLITLMAGLGGFYGIVASIVIVLLLACNAKSFGVPYFTPVAPKTKSNPDVIASLPNFLQTRKPDFTNAIGGKKRKRDSRGWVRKKGDNKQ